MKIEELYFDEEITLDYTTMPEDTTEGAQLRDIKLSELLYEQDFDLDEELELVDILKEQIL